MSDNFFSLVLGLIFLCDSSLWAADSVLVQAGQTFLPADAEVKIDKLKANAVALKEAAAVRCVTWGSVGRKGSVA